ncbi:MAG: hypothetical protein K6G92_00390 [Bacteroidaceae bacterium]|nr:hypothetical protein [Bacteroidaceae bacterium]
MQILVCKSITSYISHHTSSIILLTSAILRSSHSAAILQPRFSQLLPILMSMARSSLEAE